MLASNDRSNRNNDLIEMGKITAPYGIKGWVKVHSFTDPLENILQYKEWRLSKNGQSRPCKLVVGKRHGKGLIAQIDVSPDRNAAEQISGSMILVPRSQLPELDKDEFYWHQLEGLAVYQSASGRLFGRVSHLIETGANDVLVVKPTADSLDQRERLIPYLPGGVVTQIDIVGGRIEVDWDEQF